MKESIHIPVMMKEAIEMLNLKSGMTVVDATLGGGGYAREIYQKIMPDGKLIVFDRDKQAIERFKNNYPEIAENIIYVHSNHADVRKVLKENSIDSVDAIVADLGLSSDQLNDSKRGFTFQKDSPLDMRMDLEEKHNAMDVVNKAEVDSLADIIYSYGDERHSRKIARAIVKNRPIESTVQLAEIVKKVLPLNWKSKINPATKTFQAIRIFVNKEYEHLRIFLTDGIELLREGGRIAIVSFHSGEDRIVKNSFRTNARGCVCPDVIPVCVCDHEALVKIITKKPLKPSEKEIKNNPRSRSACLRVAERI
ncbi:MAG: 16S rRNA (cytosine(1402)-N(4))-methyltransferase RsmH [Candidatus Moranbacteria bacterium]|nr:16S rRNA (cytosine(1402)-N(4))-methyltransferase RsmH [Candidatus Moranbacteria bacterium]